MCGCLFFFTEQATTASQLLSAPPKAKPSERFRTKIRHIQLQQIP